MFAAQRTRSSAAVEHVVDALAEIVVQCAEGESGVAWRVLIIVSAFGLVTARSGGVESGGVESGGVESGGVESGRA